MDIHFYQNILHADCPELPNIVITMTIVVNRNYFPKQKFDLIRSMTWYDRFRYSK